MTTATRDLMSTSEAARALGIASETLRAWVRRGVISPMFTPIGALYDADDVHRLAAERERQARERLRAHAEGS